MSTVTVIPASNTTLSMLRVAAYCRVSSNSADQIHSYQAQITTYTNLIANHPDWKLVDIYADPGITGTSLLPRNEFQRMMTDCEAGKIDRILVKSISRFARNTKDCLSSLRQLASYGVSVLFEKENIDTKTLTTEMMVSVFGALAQQESVSISENQKISYQRRMEKGEFITCKAPFGYRLRNKTQLEIDSVEAPIVKWIFDSYLNGRSAAWIADKMTKQKILTRDHGTRWHPARVLYILTNEKYIGDTLSQKYYNTSMPFQQHKNQGERTQYLTRSTHPAIISRDAFYKVQTILSRRTPTSSTQRSPHVLSKKLYCADCGSIMGYRTLKSGTSIWVCRKHDQLATNCPNGRIREDLIFNSFIQMYNKLTAHQDDLLLPALEQLKFAQQHGSHENALLGQLHQALAQAAQEQHHISTLVAAGLLDEAVCTQKRTEIHNRIQQLNHQKEALQHNAQLADIIRQLVDLVDFLRTAPSPLQAFDSDLFYKLVQRIEISHSGTIQFLLPGKITLTQKLEEP